MKKIIWLALILLSAKVTHAQYKPVNEGSSVNFTISNFGFDVTGTFTGLAGKIAFDPQQPASDNFDVTIDAATVNTGNSLRDKHLLEDGYFDVANYPHIRLASSGISGKNGAYKFTGKLTIKAKTKDIAFPFTVTSTADGLIFHGTFKINRKDFDVGGTSTISNELQVDLTVHAIKV